MKGSKGLPRVATCRGFKQVSVLPSYLRLLYAVFRCGFHNLAYRICVKVKCFKVVWCNICHISMKYLVSEPHVLLRRPWLLIPLSPPPPPQKGKIRISVAEPCKRPPRILSSSRAQTARVFAPADSDIGLFNPHGLEVEGI